MQKSFIEFLLNEEVDMGDENLEGIRQRVAQVMRSLELSELRDAAKDPRSFTFLDLLEALHTVEDVVLDRLADDTIETERGDVEVGAETAERRGDEKRGYEHTFQGIEHEVKAAIRNQFSLGGGKLPRFVTAFNNQIVEYMVAALEAVGPQQARSEISSLVHDAANAVINLQISRNPEEQRVARNLLQNYRRQRDQIIGKKPASQRTRSDRMNLLTKIGKRIERKQAAEENNV